MIHVRVVAARNSKSVMVGRNTFEIDSWTIFNNSENLVICLKYEFTPRLAQAEVSLQFLQMHSFSNEAVFRGRNVYSLGLVQAHE